MQLILAIITAIVNIAIVLVVLTKNHKSMANRTFGVLTFVNSLYPIFNYLSLNAPSSSLAFSYAKFAIATGIITGPFYFFFVHAFPSGKLNTKRALNIGLITWMLLNLGLLASDQLFKSIVITNGKPELVVGPAIPSFGLMMLTTLIWGSWHLYRKFRTSNPMARAQIQLVMLGLFGGLGLTLVTTIILPLGLNITAFIPFSSIFLLIMGATIGFAILRRRLFNVSSIVARAAAYTLLLITVGVAYGVVAYTLTSVFFVADTVSLLHLSLNVIVTVVLAFTFQPLSSFFGRITDRVFYQQRYDSQAVLNNFSKILVSELELNHILKRSLAELCRDLHIGFGQIVIFNNERVYRVEHFGQLPQRLMVAPELATLNQSMLVADELEGGARKALMENHGIRVSLTLRTRDEFVGYLLLGDKLSGDIYSSQDIHLLEIIGKQLAVAVLNAKAYAQIEEFNLTLQARVDHATKRLRVANRHLKELDRAKDEFISMASHQLRTPLTTIKGYLSMMLEGDSGPLTPPQKEFVGYAFSSSERMVNLISDLLNVSRLSAGRFLIQTKPTDMVAMIADEVRQLKTHATAKNIKLIFDPPAEILPPAEIDDNKTRQVVMNFIDNAIYYTQEGEVRVVLEQSGDKVRLEVRDSGIGVPDAAKRKLFTKFFRADNAQTMRPDGTGLGLYLAKRVVEDQGGTIIFNSLEGKGSTFGFELPFKPIMPIREVAHARHHKSV